METIPREIDESAYIDGADTFKTFSLVIFPLLKISNIYRYCY